MGGKEEARKEARKVEQGECSKSYRGNAVTQ